MHTYQEHQKLAAVIHELSEMLDVQSRRLVELSRARGGNAVTERSLLNDTWACLSTAARLMATHAQSVSDELVRLEDGAFVAPPVQEAAPATAAVPALAYA